MERNLELKHADSFARLLSVFLSGSGELGCAFLECDDAVRDSVVGMASIVADPNSEREERLMALETIADALYPMSTVDLAEEDAADPESEKANSEEARFAERLEARMKEKGLTQTELAEMIGVGQPAISMMLNRNCRPQKRTVARLAEALGVSVHDLWPQAEE